MSNPVYEGLPKMEPGEYEAFCEFLRASCGIDLGANKQYLVATRVRRLLLQYQIGSLSALTRRIQQGQDRVLRQKVIDVMTTNETFWFRDTYPFDYLKRELLPLLAKEKGGVPIKLWSAACSTGQEPYSISISIEETLKNRFASPRFEVDILATDLSSSALDIAKAGRYDRLSVARGLSAERSSAYFLQQDNDNWLVSDSIKRRIRFRPLNLQESFYLLGKFDVIFCRNVLIYFSSQLKKEILRKLHSALNPGGILFLGSSESINGLNSLYDMINCEPGVAYRAK